MKSVLLALLTVLPPGAVSLHLPKYTGWFRIDGSMILRCELNAHQSQRDFFGESERVWSQIDNEITRPLDYLVATLVINNLSGITSTSRQIKKSRVSHSDSDFFHLNLSLNRKSPIHQTKKSRAGHSESESVSYSSHCSTTYQGAWSG